MLPGKLSLALLCAVPLTVSTVSTTGCQTAEPTVGHSNQEILGGTPISPGQFPTVIAMLVDQGRRGLCTGTLVAPDLVLTAAHCINPGLAGYATQAEVTANTIVITDAATLGQSGSTHAVVETIGHPAFGQPNDPDVGIIRLATPITDRTPTRVNFDPAKAPIGTTVTMVGYGVSDNGQAGQGFVLANRTSVSCTQGTSNSLFMCFNQTDGRGKCQGDSGGPSLAMIDGVETVVGITSFGDRDCEILGADFRTDAARTFLSENAPDLLCAADDHCDALCGVGNVPADPDCGAGCVNDAECVGDGQLCDLTAGTCYAGPGSPGGLGSPCGEGQPDCDGGFCAGLDGNQFCSQDCTVDPNNCPSGFDCVQVDGNAGACFQVNDEGGCNVGGRSGGAAALLVLIALVGLRRRRD